MRKGKQDKGTVKKPFYKKWWFWVIIIVVVVGMIGSGGDKDEDTVQTGGKNESTAIETPEDSQQTDSKEDGGINFVVSNVRNDVTGKWRKALIAENVEPKDYALDYYKKYFESDDEIHAIVNFNYKTTTKLSVIGNLLDVTIYEYVDKEELDAKILFSGMLLDEYSIDIDSGEIIDANVQETTSTTEVSPDNFIADVKGAIQGAISSKTESIQDVVLKDGDLCVYVDFSNADPAPLTLEDLALSRTSSITDAILELKDYDNLWETITIDFGEVGHITNSKSDIQTSGGGRYFPSENFKLQ